MTKLKTFLAVLLCGVILGLIGYAFASANGLLPVYPDPNAAAALAFCLLSGVIVAALAFAVWGTPR